MSREVSRQSRIARFVQSLFEQVDGDLLVYFRAVFGIVAAHWVWKQFSSGAIHESYVGPRIHFHYTGFEWVQPFPATMTQFEFVVIGIAAILIATGACYRFASVVFAMGFTHLFLVDKCLYQNHYYLICLIAWLMPLVPANRELAVDASMFPSIRSSTAPRWAILLIRFQVALPYIFGGIAKVNSDWLTGTPMRMMLAERTSYPFVGQFFAQEWCVYGFSYGGLIFDLLVVPALLIPRFRIAACVAAIGFHLMNSWLFTIGVFPWLMLLTLPIFFPPGWIRGRLSREQGVPLSPQPPGPLSARQKLLTGLLMVYVAWQVATPLRHLVIPGNPSWTEEGHYFAWHMLLRGKKSAVRLLALDPKTGQSGAADLRPFVTPFQLNRASRDPRMIHELANVVAADLRSLGFDQVQVHALALVSMNGRKPQLLIDPRVDLANESLNWKRPKWIVPLSEPRRQTAWDLPISEWEQEVQIPVEYR